jgi:hypothetical protein
MMRFVWILVAFVVSVAAAQAQYRANEWVPYTNERFGFSLRYPGDVFELERSSEAGDGQAFAGRRGHGRLLVGALANTDGYTVESYRRFISEQSYSAYNISYTQRGQAWFVLSGEGNGTVFYEKVMFSCGGSIINSFALLYPVASKSHFDPIVEGIEKTFRPGAACTAKTDATEQMPSARPTTKFYRYPRSYRGETPPTMPPTVGDYLFGNQQPYVEVTAGVWYWPGASDIRMARVPGFDPQIDPTKVIEW